MSMASEDLKDLLVNAGLNLTFGTNLFIGRMPATPDNCVVLIDVPGREPGLDYQNELVYEYPSVQVIVRNNGYKEGWETINSIREYLHGKHYVEVNSSEYKLIKCTVEPAFLRWDENNRAEFVTTFDMQKQK